MPENIATAFPAEIEVAVVCEIDDGGPVGFGPVIDPKRRAIQRIPYGGLHGARKSFLAVRAEQAQFNVACVMTCKRPVAFAEALEAAMQRMRRGVDV